MSASMLVFPTIDYFGGCPCCGRHDGYLNDGPEHWFVCHRHRVKWRVGSNLFSSWRDEPATEQYRSQHILGQYRSAEPVSAGATERTP